MSIKEIICKAFGEVSALFMSKQEKGVDIIMPTSELEKIADQVVIDIINTKNFGNLIKIITEEIKKDPELFYSYQANIAMAFKDECSRNGMIIDEKIHSIANTTAINFLNLWCRDTVPSGPPTEVIQ